VEAGYYVSSLSPVQLSRCTFPSPISLFTSSFVSGVCVGGDPSGQLGSDTTLLQCSAAPPGRRTTRICVEGSYDQLGADIQHVECEPIREGMYATRPCTAGASYYTNINYQRVYGNGLGSDGEQTACARPKPWQYIAEPCEPGSGWAEVASSSSTGVGRDAVIRETPQAPEGMVLSFVVSLTLSVQFPTGSYMSSSALADLVLRALQQQLGRGVRVEASGELSRYPDSFSVRVYVRTAESALLTAALDFLGAAQRQGTAHPMWRAVAWPGQEAPSSVTQNTRPTVSVQHNDAPPTVPSRVPLIAGAVGGAVGGAAALLALIVLIYRFYPPQKQPGVGRRAYACLRGFGGAHVQPLSSQFSGIECVEIQM
jgi:hypothetical protein